ncbi:hypothetical protein BDR26DRAFT_994918 [Obelidium mucronatum]|nr:hypothetical protein BDR26DRAFT_994918 [Obelidium mucronatum]
MSQLYEGILDPGCNKTLIPNADWFESFKEVSINIGVTKKGACLTGTRQGVVHFIINGHRITIQDAIYSVDCTTTLFANVDILANNRDWEYKVDLSGAVFFDKKTRQVLFNSKLAPSGLKMLQFEVVNRVFANAATIKDYQCAISDGLKKLLGAVNPIGSAFGAQLETVWSAVRPNGQPSPIRVHSETELDPNRALVGLQIVFQIGV